MAKTKKKVRDERTSTTEANKSLLSYFYLPIVVVISAIAAIGYFLITTQLSPINQKHQTAMIEEVASLYEAYFNNVLTQHDALIDRIAESPFLLNALETQEDLTDVESAIASQIPEGLSVHVFAMRSAQLRPDATPPLSHAALDMIRRAEQGQNVAVEAHQHQNVAYLQSVRVVRNNSDRIIGTVAIAQSIDYLKNQLASIDPSKGNFLVQQRFDGAPIQTLLTYGSKNNNDVLDLRANHPFWTMTFQPSDQLALSSIASGNLFVTGFAVLIVLCTLPFFLSVQRVSAVLRTDANNLAKQVQALLNGQPKTNVDFQLAIFNSLAKTLNRLRLGKSSPTKSLAASGASTDNSDDFDVPMIDSDSDLLGMSRAQPVTATTVTINPSIFSRYDIRGIIGQTLTVDDALLLGTAIGSEAYDRGEQVIIVARDGRLSSPELSAALIRGLRASGRDVIDIGEVPTPVCYFACDELAVKSCVMITGSHHKPNQNGFKITLAGHPLIEDEIKALQQRIETQAIVSGSGSLVSKDVVQAYIAKVTSNVSVGKALKVVADCGNGVTGPIVPLLIKQLGSHILPLNADIDGNFPSHLPDPSQHANLQELARTVVETRADVGIAFDGDGNRLAVVSGSGKIVSGDRLLMLLAKQVAKQHPNATMVFDVRSSRRLKNMIAGFNGKAVLWKTGYPNIHRKMRELNAIFGGEVSGHVFYQDRWSGMDDALYAAARLLELIAQQNETLDTLISDLPQDISSPEFVVTTTQDRKHRIIEAMQRNGQFSGQMTDIDGIRVDYADGWGIIRASTNEPNLVCRFEAETQESLVKIQSLFKQQLLAVDNQLQIPF